MFGVVPNSVTRPPIREANDIGISSDDGEVPVRRASCSAIGIRIASAPTFFDTIDSSSVAPTSTGTCTPHRGELRGRIGRMIRSTAPDRAIASDTTSAAATITTTSSEKPSKAWRTGTIPTTTPASSPPSATRS